MFFIRSLEMVFKFMIVRQVIHSSRTILLAMMPMELAALGEMDALTTLGIGSLPRFKVKVPPFLHRQKG